MITYIFTWLFWIIFAGVLVFYSYYAYELYEHFEHLEEQSERDAHQALKKMVELEVLSARIFLLTTR